MLQYDVSCLLNLTIEHAFNFEHHVTLDIGAYHTYIE